MSNKLSHELFSKNPDHFFSNPGDYTDEDFFSAMTDGQLGDYEDFSGSMDDVDTWARG